MWIVSILNYQVVFGDTDDHAEKGGLHKLGQVRKSLNNNNIILILTKTFSQFDITIFGFNHFVTNTSKSQSMDNGYVLVMSEWDDGAAHMLWLDSNYPPDADPSKPGVSDFAHLLSENISTIVQLLSSRRPKQTGGHRCHCHTIWSFTNSTKADIVLF